MKFEVINPAGRVMMWTTEPVCVPDEGTKREMRRAGYRFRQTESNDG